MTSKVAMKKNLTRIRLPLLLLELITETKIPSAMLIYCKFFASDEGCKKGTSCEAQRLPKEKGCATCGSICHDTRKCERNQPMKP
eukprot:6461010-Amphidinium_carterae.2